tara:strand:- start:211 stop:546 length:336 start_codon:yes stop_codon:yes gene_type:complete
VFRPLYTISYIGYFELNIDYIIETYCVNKEKPELKCNGKCHLADQLNLAENTTDVNYPLIVEAFLPVYLENSSLEIEGSSIKLQKLKSNFVYISPIYTQPNYKISLPPKLS